MSSLHSKARCSSLSASRSLLLQTVAQHRVERAREGSDAMSLSTRRPPQGERRFVSPAVEATIERVQSQIRDRELAWLFANCFPNTLDTTVTLATDARGRDDTFVITGDIDAMWLRDSTAQVWPYLPLLQQDQPLR